MYTAISRKVVGESVHATTPKGNMGYDQYTVPDTVAVESTFVAFFQLPQTYVRSLSCRSFKLLWGMENSEFKTTHNIFRDCVEQRLNDWYSWFTLKAGQAYPQDSINELII